MTATTTLPATADRIHITGREARDIASHVRAYLRPDSSWTEVQQMRECRYGCKLHARRADATVEYGLVHYSGYGCPLGRDEDTRVVPATLDTTPLPEPGTYVTVALRDHAYEGEVTATTGDTITLADWTRWKMGSGIPTYGRLGEDTTVRLGVGVTVTGHGA